MKHKISATITTLNEERNIANAINSLKNLVDEIIVIDSFSSDHTVKIAKKMGANVICNKFSGHIAQKQFAVDQASNQWILALDADEVVSKELRSSIIKLFNSQKLDYPAYSFNRRNFHTGKWIKHGGWYPDRKTRLFNKSFAHWGGVNPHDKVIVDGNIGRLSGDLFHYTFHSLTQNVATNNNFSSISAKIMFENNKKFHWYQLIINPLGTFLNRYIYKQGFRDGALGFIIAVGAGYSVFIKYAKLRELYKTNKKT